MIRRRLTTAYYIIPNCLIAIISMLMVSSFCIAQENNSILCSDGMDNDGDGQIDCDDQECTVLPNDGCQTCLGNGLSFADVVIDFNPNCLNNSIFQDSSQALGLSDDRGVIGSDRFVSLGDGGSIQLGFTDNLLVNSGSTDADLWIFEIGPAVEAMLIELRPANNMTRDLLLSIGTPDVDGNGFFEYGMVQGATSALDIDAVSMNQSAGSLAFDAVKLTDVLGGGCNSVAPGADLDAICALSSIPLEVCGNQIDDDGDGFTDCDDADLAADCCCLIDTLPQFGEDLSTCVGDSIQLSFMSNFLSYEWQDGSTAPTFVATITGNYSLTVTTANGCSYSDRIFINFLPDLRLTIPLFKCAEDGIQAGRIFVTEPGLYLDTLFSESTSCDTLVTYDVSNYPTPQDFLGPDITTCDDNITISSLLPTTTWPDQSMSNSYAVFSTGEVIASAIDSNGCQGLDSIFVNFVQVGNIYIPSAFSPNDDGINDVFRPFFGPFQNPTYTLTIFDRWGAAVFKRTGQQIQWDGFIDEKKAATGTYVWMFSYQNEACPARQTLHGDLLLIK